MTDSNRPFVSIVIPCYNHAEFLRTTVESIINQTFTDWECIIVNDGSTDDSGKIALDLAAEDSRVRYVYQDNKGPAAAMNRGIDEARGQYIELIGADDLMEPEKLEMQVPLLSGNDEMKLVYCDFYWCNRAGELVDVPWKYRSKFDESDPCRDIVLNWGNEITIHPACFLVDARVFTEYGVRHDENLRCNLDYELWTQVFALRPKCFHVDKKLVRYRIVPGSVSHKKAKFRNAFFQIIRARRKTYADEPAMLAVLRKKVKLVKRDYAQYAPPYELGWWIWRCRAVARAVLPNALYSKLKCAIGRG